MSCLAALCLLGALAVDGDTIKLLQPGPDLRVRIWGIDAPAMAAPGGREAKAAMAALIAGQPLACDDHGRDRHGRTVAACLLPDGRDLACVMAAAGLAQDWPRYSGGAYARCAPARPPRKGKSGRGALGDGPAAEEER